MTTRRKTLKMVVSSLLVPNLNLLSLARADDSSRFTDPACASCANIDDLKATFSNLLDGAPLLQNFSLPPVIHPIQRSAHAGTPVQFVESATGSLAFAINDLKLNCFPGLIMTRFYRSDASADRGLGAGWSLTFDDRITLTGSGAELHTAAGDIVALQGNLAAGTLVNTYPGTSLHRVIARVGATGLSEEVGAGVQRIYTLIGATYFLSAYDYGALGRIDIVRDANGRIASIANRAAGMAVTLHWSDAGRLQSAADGTGRTVAFNYTGALLTSHVDVTGAIWRYQYTGERLQEVVDPQGTSILAVEYAGATVSTTTTIARALSYQYAQAGANGGSVLTINDSDGPAYEYTHNVYGQTTGVRSLHVTGEDAQMTYDANGFLITAESATISHAFAYDASHRLVQYQRGRNQKQLTYNAQGRISSLTDVASTTQFEYDSAGNLISGTSPRKLRTFNATQESGRITQLLSNNRSLKFTYSQLGLISNIAMGDGKNNLQFSHDATGNLISEKIANQYSAAARRNARGELVDWSDSRGRHFTFQRDTRGALVRIANSDGEWTQATRDGAGRIVKLLNSRGQTRTFGYSAAGKLASWSDAKNRTFEIEYDASRKTAVRMSQAGGSLQIVRDAHGQAVVQDAARAGGASAATSASVSAGTDSFDDGWFDPLYGKGLIGSFSGFTYYGVMENAKTAGTTVPPVLGAMLSPAYQIGGDGGDGGGGDGGDGGGDIGGDWGDGGDAGDAGDGGDDEGDSGDSIDATNPDCQPCMSTYQTVCSNSYNDAVNSAQLVEYAGIGVCGLTVETGPGLALCLAGVGAILKSQLDTAATNRINCITLIPNNCYSQCH